MVMHHQALAFSSEMPPDWRHLHVSDPVVYLEQEHLIVCIIPPNRTRTWSLVLAKTGDEIYSVTVPYGHPGLTIFRPASY